MDKKDHIQKDTADIDRILFKILNGETSPADIQFFKEWMENEENRQYFNQLKEVWNAVTDAALTEEEKREAFRQFRKHIADSSPNKWKRRMLAYCKYAAIIIAAMVVGYLLADQQESRQTPQETASIDLTKKMAPVSGLTLTRGDGTVVNLVQTDSTLKEEDGTRLVRSGDRQLEYLRQDSTIQATEAIYNTVTVPRGERFSLTLADGTKVWLNAESHLTFPVNFVEDERVVRLSGQAYFEVAKDSLHPFIVCGNGVETRVLGTSFDMANYPDNHSITLVEGSVQVSAFDQKTVLRPNQQVVVDSARHRLTVREVDAKLLTQWKDGILRLDNQTFDEMLGKLSRWYGITFINQASVPSDDRFNGKFYREDIGEAMHVISLSAKIKYVTRQDTIVILPQDY